MWEAVAAGHVQRGPVLLVPLVDVRSVVHQQLHALQVPGQDSLMNGSHAFIYRGSKRKLVQHKKNIIFLSLMCICNCKASLVLTREVDGVQGDSPGLDETSNPLQLSLPHIVLKEDVIGEVHAADWLGALAADGDIAVLGVNIDSHGLRYRALIVLHSDPSWSFPRRVL